MVLWFIHPETLTYTESSVLSTTLYGQLMKLDMLRVMRDLVVVTVPSVYRVYTEYTTLGESTRWSEPLRPGVRCDRAIVRVHAFCSAHRHVWCSLRVPCGWRAYRTGFTVLFVWIHAGWSHYPKM